jgi:hypothetical protein
VKRAVAIMGLALALVGNGVLYTSAASAEVLPAKKSGIACDQGALATFNAFVAARKAVLIAYQSEVAKAKDAYELAMKTGTRSQRKSAKDLFEASKIVALENRNRALKQLGTAPKLPAGCKVSSS